MEKDGMDKNTEYTRVVKKIIQKIRSHTTLPEPKGVHPLDINKENDSKGEKEVEGEKEKREKKDGRNRLGSKERK